MALLSFVWVLVMFSTYMANNWIRTAMAARHAAWMKGNGGSPTPAGIADDFFFTSGGAGVEVDVQNGKGSIVGYISGDSEGYNSYRESHWVEVRFDAASQVAANTFPFSMMNGQVPFMPPSALQDFYEVKSHCQWDNVSDTWTGFMDALRGVWNQIKSVVGDVAGGLIEMLFG